LFEAETTVELDLASGTNRAIVDFGLHIVLAKEQVSRAAILFYRILLLFIFHQVTD
jgi:hypothetical protein